MASMPIVKKEPRKSFGFLDTKRDRFHDEAWAAVEGDFKNAYRAFINAYFRNGETTSHKKTIEVQVILEFYFIGKCK